MKKQEHFDILQGNCIDVLKKLEAESVQCVVTSPPYWGLRDYGVDEQIGLERTPEAYVEKLVSVFSEVKRVLRDDGTLWLNLGDSYAGGKGQNARLDHNLEQRRSEGRTLQRRETTINSVAILPHDDTKMLLERGIKPKDLVGIPWRVAFALQRDGWYLRSEIIWHKNNPMPESVKDRPTKSHEHIFLLSKCADYYYDYKAILEPANYDGRKDTMMKGSAKYKNGFGGLMDNPNTLAVRGHERWSNKMPSERKMEGTGNGGDGSGFAGHSGNFDAEGNPIGYTTDDGVFARNKRDVWTVSSKPYKEAHFATFPPKLIEPCILAGSREGDLVLDPFNGSGTTGAVALQHHRNYVGIELNADYIELTHKRLAQVQPTLLEVNNGE